MKNFITFERVVCDFTDTKPAASNCLFPGMTEHLREVPPERFNSFIAKEWSEITMNELYFAQEIFHDFSVEAFRYFLPSYIWLTSRNEWDIFVSSSGSSAPFELSDFISGIIWIIDKLENYNFIESFSNQQQTIVYDWFYWMRQDEEFVENCIDSVIEGIDDLLKRISIIKG